MKYVYLFGNGVADGTAKMKNTLGGKGANLAEMSKLGLPVPPGFTVTTEVCTTFYANDRTYPDDLADQVMQAVEQIGNATGRNFGDAQNPLLVSVRSGARASMPGMMDTVLNLGLTDKSVVGLIEQVGNERTGWDCYRRFIDMFGDVVMGPYTGLTHEDFEEELIKIKKKYKAAEDTDLTAAQLKELAGN